MITSEVSDASIYAIQNKNLKSKTDIPLLLDIQSDLLDALTSRVVIPLYVKPSNSIKPMTKLMPEFTVDGKSFILMTPQLAGISIKDLGEPAGNLKHCRSEIIAALDLLITGV